MYHGALYDAATRRFGGWRDALSSAGINMPNVTYRRPKNLDRNGMIMRIQNRKATEQSLRFCGTCPENRDYAFAIRREFRSWANAVETAARSDSES